MAWFADRVQDVEQRPFERAALDPRAHQFGVFLVLGILARRLDLHRQLADLAAPCRQHAQVVQVALLDILGQLHVGQALALGRRAMDRRQLARRHAVGREAGEYRTHARQCRRRLHLAQPRDRLRRDRIAELVDQLGQVSRRHRPCPRSVSAPPASGASRLSIPPTARPWSRAASATGRRFRLGRRPWSPSGSPACH